MEELTRIRREFGWSQQRLAEESGVNKATINQIERGRRSPNVETLQKLARALEVEVADLFPKVEPPLFSVPPRIDEMPQEDLYVRKDDLLKEFHRLEPQIPAPGQSWSAVDFRNLRALTRVWEQLHTVMVRLEKEVQKELG